jgi:DNA-binding CsgD family transcriptional regulator/tetratricopeptide (TPR) repeat protein
LVGRHAEQQRTAVLLAEAEHGEGGTLVVCGQAGVGKSALLGWTRDRAARFTVLYASGVPIESGLSFAALAELLGPLQGRFDELPALQASALRGALSLAPAASSDPFAAYAGASSLLRLASASQPVLLVVDDVHWIDEGSLEALLFVARRLARSRVALLMSAREGEGHRVDDQALPVLHLRGLDRAASVALLDRHAPDLAPSVSHELADRTEGNPLALMEIPEMLTPAQRAGTAALDDPLSAGPSLQRAFGRRLQGLGAAARLALLVASASDAPDLATLARALETVDLSVSTLEPAEEADLVRLDGERLEFRHPLVRSAAYYAAPRAERRRAHAALAAALSGERDSGRRVFHLAAAAVGPAEDVARSLLRIGEDAVQRGAAAHAATAFEQAARLTSSPEKRSVRLLAAGRCALRNGQLDRADELLAPALELAKDPNVRSDIVHLRGIRQMAAGNPIAAHDLLVGQADRIESHDPRRAAALLLDAATAHMETASMQDLTDTARRAGALFERVGDPRAALASVLLAEALIARGLPNGASLLAEQEPFLASADPLSGPLDLLAMAAICWGWIEEYDRAERLLERIIGIARAATALRALPLPLVAASEIALRRGDFSRSEALALEADELASETRQHNIRPYTQHCVAYLDSLRGRSDQARVRLGAAREMNLAHGMLANNYHVEAILGHLELSLGRLPEALTALEAAQVIYAGRGGGEPGLFRSTPDLVEALVRLRETRRAERLLDEYARLVDVTRRSFGRAAVARCEGLLSPEHTMDEPFERALTHHRPGILPLERARTQLCFGERLRRARRRVDAREQLHGALEAFEIAGAPVWARRAREELAATGARRHGPSAAAAPSAELTSQELRVARLVAKGQSNREVADILYLSTKTVEAHLRQVFRKLGVRSRGELAARAARIGLDEP